MLVVLDATALMSDTHCRGAAWRVIAHAQKAWGVSVYVPEVALREAIAGYGRQIAEAQEALKRWHGKHGGRLGQQRVYEQANAELSAAAEAYEQELREALETVPATVLPIPDVPHADLVDRAVTRTPPCNKDGDGYRDTLNWLSLLQLATSEPDGVCCTNG